MLYSPIKAIASCPIGLRSNLEDDRTMAYHHRLIVLAEVGDVVRHNLGPRGPDLNLISETDGGVEPIRDND